MLLLRMGVIPRLSHMQSFRQPAAALAGICSMCVCVRACVHACVRACVRVCVCVCVCVCEIKMQLSLLINGIPHSNTLPEDA